MKELILLTSEKQLQDKTYKDVFGYYDYDVRRAFINLFVHLEHFEKEDELITNICDTIAHEVMHHAIWEAREEYGDTHLFTFFEEKIIAEALGNIFEEEEYYHLVQIEE